MSAIDTLTALRDRLAGMLDSATAGPWDYRTNPSRVVTDAAERRSIAGCWNWPDEVNEANAALAALAPVAVRLLADQAEALLREHKRMGVNGCYCAVQQGDPGPWPPCVNVLCFLAAAAPLIEQIGEVNG